MPVLLKVYYTHIQIVSLFAWINSTRNVDATIVLIIFVISNFNTFEIDKDDGSVKMVEKKGP